MAPVLAYSCPAAAGHCNPDSDHTLGVKPGNICGGYRVTYQFLLRAMKAKCLNDSNGLVDVACIGFLRLFHRQAQGSLRMGVCSRQLLLFVSAV